MPIGKKYPDGLGGGGGGGWAAEDVSIWLQDGNGLGSASGNLQRRWLTILGGNNLGSHATYADSATDGTSITIHTAGIWAVFMIDSCQNGCVMGVSKNASDLTQPVYNLNPDEKLCMQYVRSGFEQNNVCRVFPAEAGDVIRATMEISGGVLAAAQASFGIVLIAPFA